MIVAESLSKAFRSKSRNSKKTVQAVQSVSFTADNNQITGLLGQNGAGKSTTLRMLATLLPPDSGTASIDDFDVVTNPLSAKQHLGFMPHNSGIYPRLTARENILYYARLCGMSKNDSSSRVTELVEQLDMSGFIDRRSAGFSQGQKTKVALARALAHRPRTIMLDEPTNGLDVMATRGLREILRSLATDGHCILFSSHIMQEVAALCDHIVIIAEGQIVTADSLTGILSATGQNNLEDAFVSAIGETV
ncbi:MAG: ATP-binding cassette domain-containing protein [Gammaproteobacteria bacterium]|nr:ATP-binding cassette domain-containing protein [Gammaproteobacteria bacterium]